MKAKRESLPILDLARSRELRRNYAQHQRYVESQFSLSFDSDVKESKARRTNLKSDDPKAKELRDFVGLIAAISFIGLLVHSGKPTKTEPRPPFNAEYVLHLLLRKDERNVVIGDLIEGYGNILERFDKRRADLWFYKQVIGSLFPLLRRAVVKIGTLVWLGRVLRRLIP
jgi:hypothetical protein